MKNKAKVSAMMYELWMLSGECGHNASFGVSSTSQKRPHTTNPLYQTYPIPRFGIHGGREVRLAPTATEEKASGHASSNQAGA